MDLLGLPTGMRLRLGDTAVVEVTGLRNTGAQPNGIQTGLMGTTLGRDEHDKLIRKAGVMRIGPASGEVRPGDRSALSCRQSRTVRSSRSETE